MGCDIHLYLEYRGKNDQNENWWSFGQSFNPGRDYALFSSIAGVRGNQTPVVEPKGIPKDLGWVAEDDYYLTIDDEFAGRENCCSLEQARNYEKYGHTISYDDDGNPEQVEHPDWHTPTWLTVEEFEKSIIDTEKFANDIVAQNPEDLYTNMYWKNYVIGEEYTALLAAAKALQTRDNDVRFVIWFDN